MSLIVCSNVSLPFRDEGEALLFHTALSVDKEVRGHLTKKELKLDGRYIHVTIWSVDVANLRASTNALLKTVDFALEIQQELG